MEKGPTREELLEARAELQRQIDILGTPSIMGLGRSDKEDTIQLLQTRLNEINKALANLGKGPA